MPKTSQAQVYDFELFEPNRLPAQKPGKPEPRKPRVLPGETQAQRAAQARLSSRSMAKIMMVALVLFGLVAAVMHTRVQLTEISQTKSSTQQDLSEALSETVRLQMLKNTRFSLDYVEYTVTNDYGMVKQQEATRYLAAGGGDRILPNGGNDSGVQNNP